MSDHPLEFNFAAALTEKTIAMQKEKDGKRPWVGLTKGERNVITDKVIGFNSCVGWEDDYAKAIEAALKEKNGG